MLTAGTKRPQGHATIFEPGAQTREIDTFTCAHCNCIVHVLPPPALPPGGTCAMCGHKMICSRCEAKGVCIPFERQLEQIEARDRFRKAAGL